ncbi:hypothetical protein BDP27DRAFT_53906 [Rhodocollybia butyracea]|uniref:NAD(P)-binding protein n=1 Tax=Rhodocollybia butyracea TaxID=206335 RepID=A0A9P5PLA3_9AGAR|nr:hypothetical protein BDP27DRAFT_53906 [Rhodocollybia butyracea]
MPYMQPRVPPLPTSLDFRGKTGLVTGANSGLGQAACLHYLRHNISTLIITVRRLSDGEVVKSHLLAHPDVKTRKEEPKILVYELDLSTHSSVTAFASKIKAEIAQLHIVLLNAGIFTLDWKTSPETQNEMSFQVNYLSNAILSLLLLPLLRITAESNSSQGPSYLSIVSSQSYSNSRYIKDPIPDSTYIFDTFNDKGSFEPWSLYPDSKLLVCLFVRELAQHVDFSTVIVNYMCPGMVATNLARDLSLPLRILGRIVTTLRGRSPEVGARVLVNAAGASGKKSHGEFLLVYDVEPVISWMETEKGKLMQRKLWRETEDVAQNLVPGVLQSAGLAN